MSVKVSVVVPVYNPGTYIDDCIESILRQSLPDTEYEAIFVDDGSTDGTGQRLDDLAAQHDNITSLHIPNSGWPGRPRNVGIDAAVGKYIYFVDNDDWIGDEALERLYERAEQNAADVVVGKEVGHGKGVPRHLFRRNIDDAVLGVAPLLDLLTPHKLFRRSFLDEHRIRFPEGRRRLEDHVFVMKAFFKASRISILADYPCYHWLLRPDASNATDRYADPGAYYENVREVLDIVDANIGPGPERDRFYAHWYRSKGLHRLRGRTWATQPNAHALEVYAETRRLALERFGPGVARHLPCKFRVLSRSVLADRLDLVSAQARIEMGIRAEVSLTSLEWLDRRLRLSISATMTYADGTPITFVRRDGRTYWFPPAPLAGDPTILDEDLDVSDELPRTTVAVVLRHRESRTEHDVVAPTSPPAQVAGAELIISTAVRADVDLSKVASGRQLTTGVWDIFVHVHSCGWGSVQRLAGVGDEAGEQHRVQPYLTQYGNLSLKVMGPSAAPTSSPPAPEPLPAPTANAAPQAAEAPGTKPLGLAVPRWLLRVPVRARLIAEAVLLRIIGRRR